MKQILCNVMSPTLLQVPCNTIHIPMSFFTETGKNKPGITTTTNPYHYWKPWTDKAMLSRKNAMDYILPHFK